MSSRFHNKFHRHNHHTNATIDPNLPDSGHDPIASPDSPFQGDFVMNGALSATQSSSKPTLFASGPSVAAALNSTNIALSANGALVINGSIIGTDVRVGRITIADRTQGVPAQGATTSDLFLVITIDGVRRGIRLWDGNFA